MATCPRCGEFLDDAHDCSSRWAVAAAVVGLTLTGTLLGMIAITALVPQPTPSGIALAGFLGGVTFAAGWVLRRTRRRKAKPKSEPIVHSNISPFQPSGVAPFEPGISAVELDVPPETSAAGKTRVLVVDDEAPVRALLARWLEPRGYLVEQAENATQALAAMSAKPSSIMLCDINMPGQNGLWLAEQVQARWPETSIIMATGLDDLKTVITSRKLGAVGYVTKPFGRELLLQALRKAELAEKK